MLARGGGSREDLWCFNDEALARAIYAANTPVISAVGHEIDYVINDFVTDFRAPTPTAAMTALLPDSGELAQTLDMMSVQIDGLLNAVLARKSGELELVKAKFAAASLAQKLATRE